MPLRPFLRTDIAYFSMEIAFRPETNLNIQLRGPQYSVFAINTELISPTRKPNSPSEPVRKP